MDLEKAASGGKTSLLTLPRSDLTPARPPPSACSSHESASASDASSASLILLQLPPGWSVEDLKDSHFVAKPQQQAALVCNSKQASFSVSTVETSNCLVLVPPLSSQDDPEMRENPTKKLKLSNDSDSSSLSSTLQVLPSRLLKAGGSGASFLEVRPKALRLADLRHALWSSRAILDPYNSESGVERSVELSSLAHDLQMSTQEVLNGLKRLEGAYPLSSSELDSNDEEESMKFVLLSEEVQLVVHHAMISTLAEADDCHDYAGTGVDANSFVERTLERMSDEERFDNVQSVIQYCLFQLADSSVSTNERLCLDVAKVARWVARRLFSIQSTPWEETLFLARWQSELPGVGAAYQVSMDMLRGLAIPRGQDGEERFWKFLPADQIMVLGMEQSDEGDTLEMRTSHAFDILFEWKERWLLDELQPYLDAIVDATAISQADLLIQYTKMIMEDFKGVSVKMYQKR